MLSNKLREIKQKIKKDLEDSETELKTMEMQYVSKGKYLKDKIQRLRQELKEINQILKEDKE